MTTHVLGCVFARGGSKGLPGKNIRSLFGRPLIAYAIDAARACPVIDRVIVSTDNGEIARIAREYGAEVPFMRPAELATDSAPELGAWRHAVQQMAAQGYKVDVLVSSPATTPMKTPEDLEHCVSLLLDSDADAVVTVIPSRSNPYYSSVMIEEGYVRLALKPERPIHRRQDAPKVYDIAGVAYAVRPSYIMENDDLLAGKVRAVEIPTWRAVDIDTELDFAFAEFLMSRAGGKP